MNFITIQNNGPEIVSTNYWQSYYVKNGYVYLSVNAGAFRLLVPPQLDATDILTASEVIISRGQWPLAGKPDALELLFEDFSTSPYCLHIGPEQIDRMPSHQDSGKTFIFSIWSKDGKIKEMPARYRIVPEIPWLKPWGLNP